MRAIGRIVLTAAFAATSIVCGLFAYISWLFQSPGNRDASVDITVALILMVALGYAAGQTFRRLRPRDGKASCGDSGALVMVGAVMAAQWPLWSLVDPERLSIVAAISNVVLAGGLCLFAAALAWWWRHEGGAEAGRGAVTR